MRKYFKYYYIILLFSYLGVNIVLASENKYPAHLYKEAVYQHSWCCARNGIEEYENSDFTRVDCLTSTHAVEFDFAKKRAKVVLILENPAREMVYYYRVKRLAEIYNFDVEYMTPCDLTFK